MFVECVQNVLFILEEWCQIIWVITECLWSVYDLFELVTRIKVACGFHKGYYGLNGVLILVGPKPGPPRNLTVTEINNGFLITWQAPLERAHLVQYYTIKYKTDSGWKTLNKASIRPEETSYLGEF